MSGSLALQTFLDVGTNASTTVEPDTVKSEASTDDRSTRSASLVVSSFTTVSAIQERSAFSFGGELLASNLTPVRTLLTIGFSSSKVKVNGCGPLLSSSPSVVKEFPARSRATTIHW